MGQAHLYFPTERCEEFGTGWKPLCTNAGLAIISNVTLPGISVISLFGYKYDHFGVN